MPVQNHNFMYNYGRPDFKLPYRSNNDRPLTLPLAPKSLQVTSPYLIGILDIRWDSPTLYAENNGLDILGVNVYKSYDAPDGPYTKINVSPVGALYYRDQTQEEPVTEDPISGGRILRGTTATGDWIIHTIHKPIIIPGTNGEIAQNNQHVNIRIKKTATDPFVTVPAFKVIGETGEVYLIKDKTYNHTTNRLEDPILPEADGAVEITYSYVSNHIQTDINRKIYYKATTLAIRPDTGEVIETPLEEVEAISPYDMEKIDWIWAEAIRRNMWILFQAGERVKVFIRKWSGVRCSCWDEQYRTGKEDCRVCYGTGYVGGFDGPYDIIVAPPETEKTIELLDVGMHITYDWNTWTTAYPLLNDRDVVVRQNNDRFSVAHVNPQGSRGAIYQQHFMLNPLPQRDVRYRIPIVGGELGVPLAWKEDREAKPSDASPVIPDKPEIPGQYQRRGRTVTFENIMY